MTVLVVRRWLALLAGLLLLPLLVLPARAGESAALWLEPYGAVTAGSMHVETGLEVAGNSTPPTGTVTLTLGGEPLGVLTLGPNGVAKDIFAAPPTPGSYALDGQYSGDDVYAPASVTVVVTVRDSTTTTLVAVPSGRDVAFRATVVDDQERCSAGVTGTVRFSHGGTVLGDAVLVPGTETGRSDASFTATGLAVGSHTFRADYSGTDCLYGSQGSVTVSLEAPSTTTVTATPSPAAHGQLVTLTSLVTAADGSVPTGSVRFSVGGSVATVALAAGRATWSSTILPAGAHDVRADYLGSSATSPSSGTTSLVVDPPLFAAAASTPVGSWPTSVVTGDFTGDGRVDTLLSTDFSFDADNDYRLFLSAQRGDGTLAPPVKLSTDGDYGDAFRLATGDLDGDARTDVALAVEKGVDLFTGGVTPLATRVLVATPSPARDVALGDVTGDGRTDLAVATASHGVLVYPQDKRGRFSAARTVTTAALSLVELTDLTGDGRLDVVGPVGSSVHLVPQTSRGGWGTARTAQAAAAVSGLDVGDVTGDGRTDVVATSGGNQPESRVQVFPQTATDGLGAPATYAVYDVPEPAVVADVDRDGRKDVLVAHGGWNAVGLLRQQPDGRLGQETLYGVPYASHYDARGMAVGDLTGDGRPDVALADYNHGLVVLRQN